MAKKTLPAPEQESTREAALMEALSGFFDAAWYQTRYPDIAAGNLPPLLHFIRHGLAELRDPNRFFDGIWYIQRYPDVNAESQHPLLHYLQTGAPALRNPHPQFDAPWYAGQHPEAAANPLLFHIRTGQARGYPTEKPLDIRDYLPSEAPPPALPRKAVVDVVIPVYRGLEETQRCIESVLANTGKPLGRIIVVDDRSPEPALSAWLRGLAKQQLIHLVRNTRNSGFVTSVNRGMKEAGAHDVVLLNSDTQVPPGWLERLTAQAYADRRIATVSPFSNNATICGYPDDHGGPPAFGLSHEALDTACRGVNAGRFVDVPTTHGFCLFIRRAALNEVGEFDAGRFGFGYGEENDFCLRASALGWRHRLACDVFVYHQGSVSFGDRARALSQRAMDLILERYPRYMGDIARHISLGAVVPFRFAVTAALLRQSRLPVILMVSHDLGGGIMRHITELTQRIADRARVLLLVSTYRGVALSVPSLPAHPAMTLPADRVEDLAVLLRSMAVTRVHIHSMLGMQMDIRALIRLLDVPFDMSTHDYLSICPQINLLPWRHNLYCGMPDIAGCNACIAHRSSHGARDIITWRADQAWQLKDAERILCPSVDVMPRLEKVGITGNAVFAPYDGVPPNTRWPMRIVPPGDGKLRIAVLGTQVDHKGGRSLASIAELVDPATTEIHLIGHTDGDFAPSALRRLKVAGRYDDADLPGMIEAVAPHLIWFPAVWPETFSYTLSAAIDWGAAIAAGRIGAHEERLTGRPFTWLEDIATRPTEWVRIFEDIRTALNAAGDVQAPARPAVNDFFDTDYLAKAGRSRRGRRRTKPRIAVMPDRSGTGPISPCGYIRLVQPLHHPAITGGFDVRVETDATICHQEAEIIVTQRLALPGVAAVDRLARHARDSGAVLVYDLDDDLLEIPRSHPDAAILRPQAKVVRRMLDAADVVWVSTSALAERLVSLRPDAIVVANGLDERIWTPPPVDSQDQPVRILCMGTTSHDRDFALIEPALVRLKSEYDQRVTIDVVGMTNRHDLPAGLNRIVPPANAWRSYPGFVHWLTTMNPPWHIGLAPLLETPFNLCKSPIKAMDYAALGLAVLASDVPVYRGSIADGQAGHLVANTSAAWYAALTWVVRNWDLRREIAARARPAFDARATLASQADGRNRALAGLLTVRKTNAAA